MKRKFTKSDAVLITHLVVKYGFTPESAIALIEFSRNRTERKTLDEIVDEIIKPERNTDNNFYFLTEWLEYRNE